MLADEGEHTFAYSLLPHQSGWDERTIAAAYALNDPWLITPLYKQPIKSEFSLVSVDSPNVIIETVKQAEDGAGLIVRLYESQRCHRKVTLRAGFALTRAGVQICWRIRKKNCRPSKTRFSLTCVLTRLLRCACSQGFKEEKPNKKAYCIKKFLIPTPSLHLDKEWLSECANKVLKFAA